MASVVCYLIKPFALDRKRGHVGILRPLRASPGGWSFSGDPSKLLAQMRLVRESASKCNIAQGHISLKHVLRSQFDATPDHKGVGGVSECAPKGSRKVCFASQHQSAKICDKHASGDMPVDMVEYLSCLPCQQALFSVVRGPFHGVWTNLPSQQRGCLDYRAVRRLSLAKVSNGRIQQGYHMVHPVARPALADLLTGLGYR